MKYKWIPEMMAHDLNTYMKPQIKIVTVVDADWEVLYINGEKKYEAECLSAHDVLSYLQDYIDFSSEEIDRYDNDFPKNFSDLI